MELEPKKKIGLGTFLACAACAPFAIALFVQGGSEASKPSAELVRKAGCMKELSDEECRLIDVTGKLWHADNCDSRDIPPAKLTLVRQYAADHPKQVKEAMEDWKKARERAAADLRGVTNTHEFMCRAAAKWIGK